MDIEYYKAARSHLLTLNEQGINSFSSLATRFIRYIWQFNPDTTRSSLNDINVNLENKLIEMGGATSVDFDATLASQNIPAIPDEGDRQSFLASFLLDSVPPSQTFKILLTHMRSILANKLAAYIALYAKIDHSEDEEINYELHIFASEMIASKHFPLRSYKRYLSIIANEKMQQYALTPKEAHHRHLSFKITKCQLSATEMGMMRIKASLIMPSLPNSQSYKFRIGSNSTGTYLALNSNDDGVLNTIRRVVETPLSTINPHFYVYSENIAHMGERDGTIRPIEATDSRNRDVPNNLLNVLEMMKNIMIPTELTKIMERHKQLNPTADSATLICIFFHYYFMLNMTMKLPSIPVPRVYNLPYTTSSRAAPSQHPDWQPLKSPPQIISKLIDYFSTAIETLAIRNYHDTPSPTDATGLIVDYPLAINDFFVQKCRGVFKKVLPKVLRNTLEKYKPVLPDSTEISQKKLQVDRNNDYTRHILGIMLWISRQPFTISESYSILKTYFEAIIENDFFFENLKTFGNDVFNYIAATSVFCKMLETKQWTEKQKEEMSPFITRCIYSMQPQTKTDYFLSLNLQRMTARQLANTLRNSIEVLKQGHSQDKRCILKSRRLMGAKFESQVANPWRIAIGAPYTAEPISPDY
ncbi:MAG: hypothetical protein VXW87_00695 [Pseudomonadota bacterium]|nr:hypothetical protein [Pseudomonadota bacterium]